jgi:phage shock protein PspC (stress-responsive transcriptional regulator)
MTQNPPPGAPPEAPTGPDAAGDPGPRPGPQDGPRATRDDIRDLARLRRTTGPDKKVAGVAGGLARHLDVDPLILRVALVVLVFFGGAGLIIYAACWLLVPEDGDSRAPFNFDDRTRTVALLIAGLIAALALIGDTMGGYGFPWPLAILAVIVLLVVAFGDRDKPKPSAPAVPYAPPPHYGPHAPQTQQGWVTPAEPGTATYAAPTTAGPSYTGPTYAGPTYSGPTSSGPGYPAPPATWQPPRPPHPRKRGPILFWFTLALAALGIGVLGIVDLAGAGVADSAYPALVVAICGVMLLVGAFYGRPGGIILVGLVAAIAMAGATAGSRWEDRVVRTPDSAAQVQARYEIGAGELILDLTDVSDLQALDGRTIEVRAGVGSIEVKLPPGVDVEVSANVGLGDAEVFGDRQDGGGVDITGSHDGGVNVPDLHLDIELGLGEIDVNVVSNATGEVR